MNMKAPIYSSIWTRLFLIIAVLGLLPLGYSRVSASEIIVQKITKEEVKSMLGNPDVTILDVRSAQNWSESERKIQGAIREDRKGQVARGISPSRPPRTGHEPPDSSGSYCPAADCQSCQWTKSHG